SILTGSHVDTVRCGGSYDGIYGIAAGLIALRYLKLTCGQPQRSLEAVSFCEEEGSRFPIAFWGSGSITGFRGEEHIRGIYDDNGIAFREAMEAAGFGNPQQPASRRDDIAAFIELHVEQGVILERMEQTIGIVDAIVGQKRYVIELSGEANHAGTTPMRMRKDALSGAAEMIVYLEQEALRLGEPLVATVGKIEAVPNTSNVIAGKVTFTLDIRHPGEAELGSFCGAVLTRFDEIAHIRGLSMDCRKSLDVAPARMDHGLSHRLEQICQAKSLSYRRMVSGAGHDAQVFQRYCPTALLFVPSCRGISHSPEEYTLPQDMAAGIAVLIELLYQLGYAQGG
ncbi:M20 family metallo-hydrolase, partial [Paenibacillus sepulcri]|nr:M20 family metallo-hydrolase [Paenibacillus sepulcri]